MAATPALVTTLWMSGFPVKSIGPVAMFSRALITIFLISAAASASGETPSEETPTRLLFAQKEKNECRIGYWHRAIKEPVILDRIDHCPEKLFFDQSREKVLFVDGGNLAATKIRPNAEINRTSLPEPEYTAWVDEMAIRPDQRKDYQPSNDTMKPIGARILQDGRLGLLTEVNMPAMDKYRYIFHRDGDGWSLAGSRYCPKTGCEHSEKTQGTGFGKYVSTSVWDRELWPLSRMPWHPNVTENRYVAYRKENQSDDGTASRVPLSVELGIEINGKSSVLTAYTTESAHMGPMHTMGVDLEVGSNETINLSKNQCMTSIVGHYILVAEFFRGRFEVTDLSTGETVLSNLSTGAWID